MPLDNRQELGFSGEMQHLLLAFIQGQHVGMVVLSHGDDGLAVERPAAPLVHRVPGDGGRGGAGPVQSVPSSVISQAFHWPHICKTRWQSKWNSFKQLALFFPKADPADSQGSVISADWLCNYFYCNPNLIIFFS